MRMLFFGFPITSASAGTSDLHGESISVNLAQKIDACSKEEKNIKNGCFYDILCKSMEIS